MNERIVQNFFWKFGSKNVREREVEVDNNPTEENGFVLQDGMDQLHQQ